jgi:hypothetical protein
VIDMEHLAIMDKDTINKIKSHSNLTSDLKDHKI